MAAWLTYFAFVGTLTAIVVPVIRRGRRSALWNQSQWRISRMEHEMGLDRQGQLRRLTERASTLQREIDGLWSLVDVSVGMEHRRLSVAKLEKQTELDDLMGEIDALRGTDAITT